MARQLQLSTSHSHRALQTAARLRPFVLSGVTQTGRKLGEGAYGCVEELSVNGLICAGKRMFDVLVNTENEGADHMIEKYYDECRLLSSLRVKDSATHLHTYPYPSYTEPHPSLLEP